MDTQAFELAGWLIGAGAACGAVTAIGVVVKKLWAFSRRIGHFLDDWGGRPERPGVDARPGVMERLDRIEHEVRRNDGSSLKDSVARTETKVQGLTREVGQLRTRMDERDQ